MHKFIFSALSSLILIALCCCAFSQDSAKTVGKYDTIPLYYRYEGSRQIHVEDTSLDNIHIVDRLKLKMDYMHLGGHTTASNKITYSYNQKPGFEFGMTALGQNGFRNDNIKYFDTKSPFTSVFFASGIGKQHLFKMVHTQNVKNNWNFAVLMNRESFEGIFLEEEARMTNIGISTIYEGKGDHYVLQANFIINDIVNQESGGLTSTTDYEEEVKDIDRYASPVKLNGAEFQKRDFGIHLVHGLNLGSSTEIKINDSTTRKEFKPFARLSHTLDARTEWYLYSDDVISHSSSDTLIYENYYDSLFATRDSTSASYFENGVMLSILKLLSKSNKRNYRIDLGIKHQYIDLYRENKHSFMNNIITHAKIFETESNKYDLNLGGYYVVDGPNKNDLLGTLYYSRNIGVDSSGKAKNEIDLELYYGKREPNDFHIQYYSNHFFWNNNFLKTSSYGAKTNYVNNPLGIKIDANYSYISNYLYMDEMTTPKQLSSKITYMALTLEKKLKLGRFHFNNKIKYQYTDNDTLRIPEWITNHTFYYEKIIFKKAMKLRLGVDAIYISDYFSNAFMPVTNQFYFQDKQSTGDQLILNLFVSFRIKQARAFIKYQNLNGKFSDRIYYATPDYAIVKGSFHFGLNWLFNN